jgi:chromosomal replication initiator protein
LSCGIACEIKPPTFVERLEILRRLCSRMRLVLDEEILSLVAGNITAGVRQLQGALNRLQLIIATQRERLTTQTVAHALADLAQQCTRPVRLADIQKAVCEVFGIEPAGLRSDRKARSLSEPRMLAMWLARKYTRAPWSEIGHFFGRRSHSTVISAHRRVENLMSRQGSIAISDQTCTVEDAIRRLECALRTA